MNQKYRHEYKYIISDTDAVILKERLKKLMTLDTHTGGKESYNIRSLYYDNYIDGCYYDNENGNDPKEKFRIRIYNGKTSRISLECKRKERGKTNKEACLISEEQCKFLMGESKQYTISELPTLARKLALLKSQQLMKPVVIVEYDRIPFVYATGNVRVTIDQSLRTSSDVAKFLTGGYSKRPIIQSGFSILEVKWDELIPDWLFQVCQLDSLVHTACSKYYYCRQYHM